MAAFYRHMAQNRLWKVQRLDAMVRMVFAAGKAGLTVEQPSVPPARERRTSAVTAKPANGGHRKTGQ